MPSIFRLAQFHLRGPADNAWLVLVPPGALKNARRPMEEGPFGQEVCSLPLAGIHCQEKEEPLCHLKNKTCLWLLLGLY